MNPTKSIIFSILFIVLLSFIWYGGLKPLYINRDINMADHYVRTKKCDKALDLMQSNVIHNSSTIDSYAKLKYIGVIEHCNARTPEAIELLKKVTEIRPYYTRTYIFLGNYTGDKSYFDKAEELSPRREEIFIGRAKLNLSLKNYLLVLNNVEECIKINPVSRSCWWLKIISNFYLDDIEQVKIDLQIAGEKGLSFSSEKYLIQIHKACEITENNGCYQELAKIYKIAILSDRLNLDYNSSLARIYEILEDWKEAGYWAIRTSRHASKAEEYELEKEMRELLKNKVIPYYNNILIKKYPTNVTYLDLSRFYEVTENYNLAEYWALKAFVYQAKIDEWKFEEKDKEKFLKEFKEIYEKNK